MGTFDEGARVRVGEALKFKAQSDGMTQAELAEGMGVSASTVSKVWSGTIKRPLHYTNMASALGTTLEALLGGGEADEAAAGKVIPLGVVPSAPSCHVITVAARKGGSTKTTTSVHLAGGFARMGLRCLLVDMDGQRDSTEWLVAPETEIGLTADDVLRRGADPAEAIVPSMLENLDVLPAGDQMDTIESAMAGQWGMERRLDELIEPLRARYDVILYDCPAAMDFRIVSALMSSDWALIPTTSSTLDIKGLVSFIPRVLHYADPTRFNPRLQFLGIAVTRVKRNTLLARDARAWLGEEFSGLLFDAVVHESTRYQELAGFQALIYDHDPERAGDYEALALEVAARAGFEPALERGKEVADG
jgi:chromosome partitioning protein